MCISQIKGGVMEINNGILDLMPAKGTLVYELLRIGLRYDHADMDGETWDDYASGLTATFTSREADKVTFTDIDTHMSQVVSVSDLPSITRVRTWRTSDLSNATASDSGVQPTTGDQGQPSA